MTCFFRTALALLCFSFVCRGEQVAPPTSTPLDQTFTPLFSEGRIEGPVTAESAISNFRLLLSYDAGAPARLVLTDEEFVELPAGKDRQVELAYEHPAGGTPQLRVWHEGRLVEKGRTLSGAGSQASASVLDPETSSEVLDLGKDFTVVVGFQGGKNGALFAKCLEAGKWVPDAKALYLKNGSLIYDIGWKGALRAKSKVVKDREQVAVLVSEKGSVRLYLNGKLEGTRKDFAAGDPKTSRFKVGSAAEDFGGEFDGKISGLRFWKRALDDKEIASLSKGDAKSVNTPDFDWQPPVGDSPGGSGIKPALIPAGELVLHSALMQPLSVADHQALVAGWNDESLKRGEVIYNQLCVTCHGTLEAPGSLPTAPRFHLGELRNGDDPYRMFQTLEKGYGMMVSQPQYSTAQKYDVIHYLREHFLKDRNEKHYQPVDEKYLSRLPRGMIQKQEKAPDKKVPQYLLQDFGNVLFWTLQVEQGNIAQKGIAVRLDNGPGGVSRGKAWALYDHDTMRLAALWSGDQFVDWRGIAFDGSHGTHTSIVGDKHFVFPNEPMWIDSAEGTPEEIREQDARIRGRDDRPYGPLPFDQVRFTGLEMHGDSPVIRYTVRDCEIRETIGYDEATDSFERILDCGPLKTPVALRLDEHEAVSIPVSNEPFRLRVKYGPDGVTLERSTAKPDAPSQPRSSRFAGQLTTTIQADAGEGPFAVDVLETPAPADNPWQSWMRTSGFDFFEGGKSAAVCTWNGDVWIVDGIDQSEGELKWQRICSGLFQPLGLKILDGQIYVSCRDMIAILRDFDGDRETDYIENFNSDHQVTEHFHEFAMGLQSDDEGNLYYAKSARHAKQAVVPHHGTLLKVAKDGSSTEILATGFRAANGVCLNPDGSFMVTDQEGNWNPKNRINWVKGRGVDDFYGNMWGYHSVTDESDSVMQQPLCWITNRFDRSPAELLWVPEDSSWSPLKGSLLNLSYGAGKIYTVPFEKIGDKVQGGMCPLPIEMFPTGVMRGRFSPTDGQLYACGMFAWAGNRHEPGGFYRIRYRGGPVHQPVEITTDPGKVMIRFSDPLDKASVESASSWKVQAWDLKRTSKYGSKHFNEREWKVEEARLSPDGTTVELSIPDLAETWGMSIEMDLIGADGSRVEREIHNSIFTLE